MTSYSKIYLMDVSERHLSVRLSLNLKNLPASFNLGPSNTSRMKFLKAAVGLYHKVRLPIFKLCFAASTTVTKLGDPTCHWQ